MATRVIRAVLALLVALSWPAARAAAQPLGCAQMSFQDLVAWYPLNDGNGATAITDIHTSVNPTGPPHTGVPLPGPVGPVNPVNGPAPVAGLVGARALYFYGPNHFITVPADPQLDFGTGDFSIDAWIRIVDVFETAPGFMQPIVDKYNSATQTGFAFYVLGSTGPPVGAKGGSLALTINGVTFTTNPSAVVLPAPWANPLANTGPWHHVAVTVNRGLGLGRFYVDGVVVGTFIPPAAGSVNNQLSLLIGETRVQGPRGELAIDELQIFARELDGVEVGAIYGAGAAGKCRVTLAFVADVSERTLVPGQLLTATVGLSNPGLPGAADIFVGVLLPNGAILFLGEDGQFMGFGTLGDLASFKPAVTGVPLAAPFSVTIPSFFSYHWTGGEPHGTYWLLVFAARTGTLADGILADGDFLGMYATPFAYP
jgi:hypothetical protein